MATEEIEVLTPISVEAEVQKYTLVGDDIYVKRYVNDNIPIWYKDLIDNVINSNSTVNSQQDAIDYLNTLGLGFSQSITSLQNKDVQIDSAIESLVTSNGANTSAIGQLEATKVTASEATAIANNSIGSYFGNEANSWFNSKISTYSSAITSNTNSISTLSSSLNGANVRIDDISTVSIDENGYMLGASKLGTAPDGSITGWQFADGTNVQSTFKIMADNFSVSDGTSTLIPFSINNNQVKFDGVVDFTNTNAYGTTTIDGSKITTGSIDALQISANAITGKTITGGVINGTSINGVNITGAVIKSSWIDYTTSGALTNWAAATDITNPSSTYYSYRNNFAKNNDGSFVVDSNGYYRLPTTSKPSTVYKSANGSASGTYGSSAISLGALYSDLYSYRSYTISTVNRVIKQSPSFVAVDASTPLIDFSSTGGWRY